VSALAEQKRRYLDLRCLGTCYVRAHGYSIYSPAPIKSKDSDTQFGPRHHQWKNSKCTSSFPIMSGIVARIIIARWSSKGCRFQKIDFQIYLSPKEEKQNRSQFRHIQISMTRRNWLGTSVWLWKSQTCKAPVGTHCWLLLPTTEPKYTPPNPVRTGAPLSQDKRAS
jgi:hypothetical protein